MASYQETNAYTRYTVLEDEGGKKMLYEKPEIELILLTTNDVITLSVGTGDGGYVDGTEGGWGN